MSGTETAATRLTRDTAALVREQVEQLTHDLADTVRDAGAGAIFLVGAGTCGLLAVAAAHQTVLRALESMMPRPLAALTLTAAYGGGAAALASAGVKKIKEAADASSGALAENRQEATTVAGTATPGAATPGAATSGPATSGVSAPGTARSGTDPETPPSTQF